MDMWTFLLTFTLILLGVNGYLIWLSTRGSTIAAYVLGVVSTLLIGIIFYGLREWSQFNFNKQKMEEAKLNIEENTDLLNQQFRTSLLLAKNVNEQSKGLLNENKALRNDPRLLNSGNGTEDNNDRWEVDWEAFDNFDE